MPEKWWHSLWWLLQLSGLDTTMQSSHPAVSVMHSHAKQKKKRRKKCHGLMTRGGISEECLPSMWMPSYVYITEETNLSFYKVLEKIMEVKQHREYVEGRHCDPFWASPSPLSLLLGKLELILYRNFCQLHAWATPDFYFFLFCQPTVQFNSIQRGNIPISAKSLFLNSTCVPKILPEKTCMPIEGRSCPSLRGFRVHRAEPRTRGERGLLLLVVLSI